MEDVRNKTKTVRRRRLKGMLERVTQEMYKRNFELAESNKTLSLLRTIDTLVLESHDSLDVLGGKIAQAIAGSAEYPFVALLSLSQYSAHELKVTGWSGLNINDKTALTELSKVRVSTRDEWFEGRERSIFINLKGNKASKIAEVLNIPVAELRLLKEHLPLTALYVTKLTTRDSLVGAMAIGFTHEAADLPESDKALLERLGDAVGVAVDNKLLFEENQRVLKKLQATNEKLKALDEAKDEFISMASHQLRTPLTSVKGYLSMVIEGDAGTVTPMQRKFLDQAFDSSQRMVYLIADLLNVSRLKTGKFVIEKHPTNLADVVEGEISQLVETAAGRGLKLLYDKPKKFPALMLDETKIRQVIMNFTDNAIYYTPAGGTIKVHLKETAQSVEFTVVDNGLGVPKAEQHHMFTKFYRAGNAKKARPDGTGLGLFMAKKVVVAQGGSIIFKSQEGKGSTFGFSFARAKLAVPANPEIVTE